MGSPFVVLLGRAHLRDSRHLDQLVDFLGNYFATLKSRGGTREPTKKSRRSAAPAEGGVPGVGCWLGCTCGELLGNKCFSGVGYLLGAWAS
jgi:hypothetical protein